MEIRPEHYFQAATQRMRQALLLFDDGSAYALSMYAAGVAVECLLRAFKGRRDMAFDDRHDLLRLFGASGMLRVDRDKLSKAGWSDAQIEEHLRTLRAAVNDIYRLWSNSYRFSSEERLRSHLKKVTSYRKIKGDYLRVQARTLLNSAQRFIEKGVVQWQA